MKNNKLLAEYLEYEIFGYGQVGPDEYLRRGYYKNRTALICDINKWQPDINWSQLMLVVEKIEEDGLTWTMEHKRRYVQDKNVYFFRIWDDEDDNPIVNVNKFQRIEAVYNACVEYITIKNEIK